MQYRYLIVATFIVAGTIIAIDYWWFDGLYLLGPAISLTAYVWRGALFAFDFTLRGIMYQLGWRRVFRTVSFVTMGGIGLTYLVTNPEKLRKVRGWKGRIINLWLQAREWWIRQTFVTKLAITLVLVLIQLPFFVLPLLFPVGFLIAGFAYVLRKIHLYFLDERLGGLYWQKLRAFNRRLVSFLRQIPGVSIVFDGLRSQRLSFRCGWRLWKYDPRFRDPFETGHHHPIDGRLRLIKAWWLGEWRRYHGCPLLAGKQKWPPKRYVPQPWYAEENAWYSPFVLTLLLTVGIGVVMELTTGQEILSATYHNVREWWLR